MVEKLMRSVWLRRSGSFWAIIVLMFAALFCAAEPTVAASHSSRAKQESVRSNRSNKTFTRQARAKRNKVARVKRTKRSKVARGRWIQVDLSSQRLIAWEGGRQVYSTRISSGKRGTPTRVGTYRIQRKYRSKTMRGPGYVAPNVPYAMYYSGGYAIHGAYWHNKFGTPVSHGCVNLPVGQARRLYSWAGPGTRVVVQR